MRHELVSVRDWMGITDEKLGTISWFFDVGGHTVELTYYQHDPARARIRTYRRKLNPLPPKPFMWLGADAEAA
jgi:hypothetical protein